MVGSFSDQPSSLSHLGAFWKSLISIIKYTFMMLFTWEILSVLRVLYQKQGWRLNYFIIINHNITPTSWDFPHITRSTLRHVLYKKEENSLTSRLTGLTFWILVLRIFLFFPGPQSSPWTHTWYRKWWGPGLVGAAWRRVLKAELRWLGFPVPTGDPQMAFGKANEMIGF